MSRAWKSPKLAENENDQCNHFNVHQSVLTWLVNYFPFQIMYLSYRDSGLWLTLYSQLLEIVMGGKVIQRQKSHRLVVFRWYCLKHESYEQLWGTAQLSVYKIKSNVVICIVGQGESPQTLRYWANTSLYHMPSVTIR